MRFTLYMSNVKRRTSVTITARRPPVCFVLTSGFMCKDASHCYTTITSLLSTLLSFHSLPVHHVQSLQTFTHANMTMDSEHRHPQRFYPRTINQTNSRQHDGLMPIRRFLSLNSQELFHPLGIHPGPQFTLQLDAFNGCELRYIPNGTAYHEPVYFSQGIQRSQNILVL